MLWMGRGVSDRILRGSACDSSMTHMFNENRHGRTYRYYRCVNAVKRGADPALCEETFRQVQVQAETERRRLKAEAKRIIRETATVRGELDRLTTAVARATGATADAASNHLGCRSAWKSQTGSNGIALDVGALCPVSPGAQATLIVSLSTARPTK